jgi:hypothetical protein
VALDQWIAAVMDINGIDQVEIFGSFPRFVFVLCGSYISMGAKRRTYFCAQPMRLGWTVCKLLTCADRIGVRLTIGYMHVAIMWT